MNKAEYADYLKSPVWEKLKKQIWNLHNGRCNRCGARGSDVHHRTYDRVGGAERLTDLELLCRSCHSDQHAPTMARVEADLERAVIFLDFKNKKHAAYISAKRWIENARKELAE